MDDFTILYVVGLFVAFWLGKRYAHAKFLYNLSEHPERTIEALRKIKEINDREANETGNAKTGTELAIERHGNVLYAFTKETNQFIAQGNTLSALLDEANKRYPDRKFFGTIPDGDSAKDLAK